MVGSRILIEVADQHRAEARRVGVRHRGRTKPQRGQAVDLVGVIDRLGAGVERRVVRVTGLVVPLLDVGSVGAERGARVAIDPDVGAQQELARGRCGRGRGDDRH